MNLLSTMTTKIRSYSELSQLKTFEERYEYLALRGQVGQATFGFDRWINQQFYTSREWRNLRRDVIVRDESCDLGVEGYDIHVRLYVHHMNPLTQVDIVHGTDHALNPEYLICVTHNTHNAIHYGDKSLLAKPYEPRRPGDTKLW
jgi:hypothetical protein